MINFTKAVLPDVWNEQGTPEKNKSGLTLSLLGDLA